MRNKKKNTTILVINWVPDFQELGAYYMYPTRVVAAADFKCYMPTFVFQMMLIINMKSVMVDHRFDQVMQLRCGCIIVACVL